MNTKLDKTTVISVYSGRHGCMCGCKGKYSYASRVKNDGLKLRGYAFDGSDISDANITRVVNFINDNVEGAVEEDGYVVVETPTRVYVAYLTR